MQISHFDHAAAARPFHDAARMAFLALLVTAGLAQAQTTARAGPTQPTEAAPQRLAAADLGAAIAAGPASPHRRANADHPGVAQWRQASDGHTLLDTDHFTVQPPASARWTLQAAP